MDTIRILALLFRPIIMSIVYYLLFIKFYRAYLKTKKANYPNRYFQAFSFLFGILCITQILYGIYQMYGYTALNPIALQEQFSWYERREDLVGTIINNQMRPLFLSYYILLNVVFASLVYPVERALEMEKNYMTKTILAFGFSLLLNFIPLIGNSDLAAVIVVLGFLGMALGLLMNLIGNLVLFFRSTGDIRKRSMYSFIAFIFISVGFLWSLEVGYTSILVGESVSYRWDVVVGSILQIIGSFFYLQGFKPILSEEEPSEKEPIISRLKRYIKGEFRGYEVFDWSIIGMIIGLGFIGLAWVAYPKENAYNIMKDTISFLGSSDPDNNPEGWWLFSIAMIAISITLVPLNIYRKKRLEKISPSLAKFTFILYMIAALGLFLIAIFPDNQGESFFEDLSTGKIHNIVALFAFVGFGFGILFDFLIFIEDIRKTHILKKWPWIVSYSLYFPLIIGVSITQTNNHEWPGEGIYSFPLWEWITFGVVLIVYFLILLTLPMKIPEPEGESAKHSS